MQREEKCTVVASSGSDQGTCSKSERNHHGACHPDATSRSRFSRHKHVEHDVHTLDMERPGILKEHGEEEGSVRGRGFASGQSSTEFDAQAI